MGRSVKQTVAAPATDRRAAVDVGHDALRDDVEGLRELRRIAGKAQADIASALNIKQPSVSKIENQADMYLSTLRSYVEAVGGELEIVVRMPKLPALRIHQFCDALAPAPGRPNRRLPSRGVKPRHG